MKKKNIELEKQKKRAEKMTLDQIEDKMTELAINCTPTNFFMSSKQIEMLEKVGNFKIKKQQIELQKEQAIRESELAKGENAQPITVQFVSAKEQSSQERLARLEQDVISSLNGNEKNNA